MIVKNQEEDEKEEDNNDKFRKVLKYPGIFDMEQNSLYQSIRNLYSLSMR